MTHPPVATYDIIKKIFYMADTCEQFKLRSTCKLFSSPPILCIEHYMSYNMTDKDLSFFPNLLKLI